MCSVDINCLVYAQYVLDRYTCDTVNTYETYMKHIYVYDTVNTNIYETYMKHKYIYDTVNAYEKHLDRMTARPYQSCMFPYR